MDALHVGWVAAHLVRIAVFCIDISVEHVHMDILQVEWVARTTLPCTFDLLQVDVAATFCVITILVTIAISSPLALNVGRNRFDSALGLSKCKHLAQSLNMHVDLGVVILHPLGVITSVWMLGMSVATFDVSTGFLHLSNSFAQLFAPLVAVFTLYATLYACVHALDLSTWPLGPSDSFRVQFAVLSGINASILTLGMSRCPPDPSVWLPKLSISLMLHFVPPALRYVPTLSL
ncbi:hypothetical protein SCLCIDRAFT_27639 [Scleroderma citrinum Foug A]|uniref:Uncharacterized protein n=1 Tax=Scleroderma citrinum Foug A TaxID=1036808 RepID=A0A0C2ZAL5_9AGAM|nr:hypothetical protein SCLCIDRAFT_27639 [Scleroderma citrinum Foug A]